MLSEPRVNTKNEIVIIGAGLCGMMMALYLARKGYDIEIYEKEINSELHAKPSKRASELDLSARALLALSEVGLLKEVIAKSMPTENRVVIFPDQSRVKIPHSVSQTDIIYNISRSDLYKILYTAVEKNPHIKVNFSHLLISADLDKKILIFSKNDSDSFLLKKYSVVLGCDGANSILRRMLNKEKKNKAYSHVYKEITLPEFFVRENLSLKNMYKWIDDKSIFLAHPMITHTFSGTLIVPERTKNTLSEIFATYSIQFQSIIRQIFNEIVDQPFGRLKTTQVRCQHSNGILLLGDAAHGMLPFLGQGINCAFEDCRLFNNYLGIYKDNWNNAMANFVKSRQIDTNAIIEMSEIEYQEFDDLYDFEKDKDIENIKLKIISRYPNFIKPYRHLLAFTHMPYREIKQQQHFQRQLFTRIYQRFKITDNIPWKIVDGWIDNNCSIESFPSSSCTNQ